MNCYKWEISPIAIELSTFRLMLDCMGFSSRHQISNPMRTSKRQLFYFSPSSSTFNEFHPQRNSPRDIFIEEVVGALMFRRFMDTRQVKKFSGSFCRLAKSMLWLVRCCSMLDWAGGCQESELGPFNDPMTKTHDFAALVSEFYKSSPQQI